jgi:hypothetical protein
MEAVTYTPKVMRSFMPNTREGLGTEDQATRLFSGAILLLGRCVNHQLWVPSRAPSRKRLVHDLHHRIYVGSSCDDIYDL